MSVCPAKSSAFSIGVIILSTVRKAAKFAVYDDIIMSVKNHHMPPTIRVDVAYKNKSIPPLHSKSILNARVFKRLLSFTEHRTMVIKKRENVYFRDQRREMRNFPINGLKSLLLHLLYFL